MLTLLALFLLLILIILVVLLVEGLAVLLAFLPEIIICTIIIGLIKLIF